MRKGLSYLLPVHSMLMDDADGARVLLAKACGFQAKMK
jgi:hypothetical protein